MALVTVMRVTSSMLYPGSFGKVAAYPPSAFGDLAHIGPMARSVGDVKAMLDASCRLSLPLVVLCTLDGIPTDPADGDSAATTVEVHLCWRDEPLRVRVSTPSPRKDTP